MRVGLAIIHHDPQGRLYPQIATLLPELGGIFIGLAVYASAAAHLDSLACFAAAGALVRQDTVTPTLHGPQIGRARRSAIALALQLDCAHVMYCDSDRILHWVAHHPQELGHVVSQLGGHDLTVVGRTRRAFESHPRTQRDTEAIINHVFHLVSGQAWDVAGAARGLSRPAVEAVVAGCPDEEISTDVSWPLFLQRAGVFSLAYLEAEGLEFETADRYGDEVAAAGGLLPWVERIERDPRQWVYRLEMARVEVQAVLAYDQRAV
jgi:hypothetical protein